MNSATCTCEFIYAANEAEFAAALDRDGIDLIMSDFTLRD